MVTAFERFFGGLCLLLAASAVPANAQGWPEKAVTLVIVAPAGSSSDTLGRLIADKVNLGQPVVVENRPGASGTVAAAYVARAAPDGYTLLLSTSSSLAPAVWLFKDLPYDPLKDFAPITQLSELETALVVPADFPANTVAELVSEIKKNPGKYNYGSAGNGALGHVAFAYFANKMGLEVEHITYAGGAPSVTALVAHQVQMLVGPIAEVLPFIKGGQLKAIAITSNAPVASLPGVEMMRETIPEFNVPVWQAILAPAGTPKDIVDKVAAAAKAALDADATEKLKNLGIRPVESSPAQLEDFMRQQVADWKVLVELSGAKVD